MQRLPGALLRAALLGALGGARQQTDRRPRPAPAAPRSPRPGSQSEPSASAAAARNGWRASPASATAAFTASGPPRWASARSTATATPSSARSASDSLTITRSAAAISGAAPLSPDSARRPAASARSDAFSSCCLSVCRKMVAGPRIPAAPEADERRPANLVDVALGRADHEIAAARHAQPPERLQLGAPHERPRLLLGAGDERAARRGVPLLLQTRARRSRARAGS